MVVFSLPNKRLAEHVRSIHPRRDGAETETDRLVCPVPLSRLLVFSRRQGAPQVAQHVRHGRGGSEGQASELHGQ